MSVVGVLGIEVAGALVVVVVIGALVVVVVTGALVVVVVVGTVVVTGGKNPIVTVAVEHEPDASHSS